MKLQSYTATAQIPREASALLNRRKQTHFLSSKLHKSHSPQESFFLSFVFLKMDFKRGNHWHCPSNLTKVGQKPKIFYIKEEREDFGLQRSIKRIRKLLYFESLTN